MELRRSVNGAIAGSVAAAVWAVQQPLDKRVFDSDYDDVELLGKLVTQDSSWPAVGFALHAANGAVFGAVYAQLRPFLPGPPIVSAVLAGMAENFGFWPSGGLVDRYHPARGDLPRLAGNRRALAQATWRHLVFSVVLGELERRLNAPSEGEEPPAVPAASNGHGNIELAVGAA
jgi:hypothetical protein